MSYSKIEYDLGNGGGRMALIQAIIKPQEDEQPKPVTKKSSHPYYRRHGRHNNDICDACEEGGALICCDRCPSSFHLTCHDPPLNEADIPLGMWLCHTCRMTSKSGTATTSSRSTSKRGSVDNAAQPVKNEPNSDTSRPDTPANDGADKPNIAKLKIMKNRSTSRISSVSSETSNPPEKIINKLLQLEAIASTSAAVDVQPPEPVVLSPMEELIKAARLMNPRQFELPREMNVYVQFPGSDKVECVVAKNGTRKFGRGRKPHELDYQGMVPLPAKLCHVCRKSCKRAPLVSCDYCSLYFHQDCLDPPMTALPIGMWMCPNHPEQFIDWKLVNSVSATERIKLWDHYTGPVDQEAVKIEFFRKVHTKNPYFRSKLKLKPRDRVDIPPMVEYHYRNPPSLLPSLRDVLRIDSLTKRPSSMQYLENNLIEMIDAELKVLDDANKKIDALERDLKMDVTEPPENKPEDTTVPATAAAATTVEVKPIVVEPLLSSGDEDKENKEEIDLSLLCEETIEPERKRLKRTTSVPEEQDDEDAAQNAEDQKIDAELEHLDMALIKLLAFQRMQQILTENPELVEKYHNRTAAKAIRELIQKEPKRNNLLLPSELLTKEDIAKIARKFTAAAAKDGHVREDGYESRSPSPVFKMEETSATPGGTVTEMKIEDIRKSAEEMDKNMAAESFWRSQIRARAVLTPVDEVIEGPKRYTKYYIDKSIFMRYRNLTIGSGPGADVHLNSFGHCRFISKKHAVIFYDEITRNYELLNYSEFGSEINGQLYTCDYTDFVELEAENARKAATEAILEKQREKERAQLTKEIRESSRQGRDSRIFKEEKRTREVRPAKPPVEVETTAEKNQSLQENLRAVIDKRRVRVKEELYVDEQARMAAPLGPACNCKSRNPMLAGGWEGTAILQHGSLLKFGCVSFIFSVADYDSGIED